MYAGRVACCLPLVSHVEFAPCALLTLGKKLGHAAVASLMYYARRRNNEKERPAEVVKTRPSDL